MKEIRERATEMIVRKPCPFCGGAELACRKHHLTDTPKLSGYRLICKKCLAQGPAVGADQPQDAIRAWDLRSGSDG